MAENESVGEPRRWVFLLMLVMCVGGLIFYGFLTHQFGLGGPGHGPWILFAALGWACFFLSLWYFAGREN